MNKENEMIEKEAQKELEKGKKEAEALLKEPEKLEISLIKLENKLKEIPKLGDTIAIVPTLISMVRSYVKKEYTELPVGTITAIISALIYFLSPIDVVPDVVPGFGYVDDVAVILACLKWVGDDVKEYEKWRKENNKNLV